MQNPSVDSSLNPTNSSGALKWSMEDIQLLDLANPGPVLTPDIGAGTYSPIPESSQIFSSHSSLLSSPSCWDQSHVQPWHLVGIAAPAGASSFSSSFPGADSQNNHFSGSPDYTRSEVGGTSSSLYDYGHRRFASDSHSANGGLYQTHLLAVPGKSKHNFCPQPRKHDIRGETCHHSGGSSPRSQDSRISQGSRYKGPPLLCPHCHYRARTPSQLRYGLCLPPTIWSLLISLSSENTCLHMRNRSDVSLPNVPDEKVLQRRMTSTDTIGACTVYSRLADSPRGTFVQLQTAKVGRGSGPVAITLRRTQRLCMQVMMRRS